MEMLNKYKHSSAAVYLFLAINKALGFCVGGVAIDILTFDLTIIPCFYMSNSYMYLDWCYKSQKWSINRSILQLQMLQCLTLEHLKLQGWPTSPCMFIWKPNMEKNVFNELNVALIIDFMVSLDKQMVN